jgi:hypothetical protein
MESVFRGSTAWAGIRDLLAPCYLGDADSTVFGAMLCGPSSAGETEGFHGFTTDVPIDMSDCFWMQTGNWLERVMSGPISEGSGIFQNRVNIVLVST